MTDERGAAVATLASLTGLGAGRLGLLLAHHDPVDALRRLVVAEPLHPMVEHALRPVASAVRGSARAASVDDMARRLTDAGVAVVLPTDPDFPAQLTLDPDPPGALFVRGDLGVLAARRVGVIGTRNATPSGLATARELGEALGDAGVAVVSGLARGIDAAAHAGVRRSAGGSAVAVVGCGPDRPYPSRNAELWGWVASAGLLVSEYPPGTEPHAWRFPRRNRILAALCEILVVVESRERGGSLITAREALDRDVEVMAVPGSPRSRASAGTNRLLVDGAAPITSVDDVLVALGLDHRRCDGSTHDPRPRPDAVQERVLEACRRDGPSTLDALAVASGLPLADAALAAARLERSGWLVEAGGWLDLAGSRLSGP